jgi:hypothetical protein
MRRTSCRGLSSGTSPERIAPESLTRIHSGFVHRNISRCQFVAALDQVWRGSTRDGHATELLNLMRETTVTGVNRNSRFLFHETVIPGLVPATTKKWVIGAEKARSIPVMFLGPLAAGSHCVLATRGGVAVVMNWVASSMAGPSGVGIFIRNGTRMRVPATGANAISMCRSAARYFITARSGM